MRDDQVDALEEMIEEHGAEAVIEHCRAEKPEKASDLVTILALHGWVWSEGVVGGCQTYCDLPRCESDEQPDGWNIHIQYRTRDGDELRDPEGAPDLDFDVADYAAAKLIADALCNKYDWELREY